MLDSGQHKRMKVFAFFSIIIFCVVRGVEVEAISYPNVSGCIGSFRNATVRITLLHEVGTLL